MAKWRVIYEGAMSDTHDGGIMSAGTGSDVGFSEWKQSSGNWK